MALSGLERLLAPLKRRVMLMVSRAVVGLVNDAPAMQELQVSLFAGETRGQVERFQNCGFTSAPHPGAEAAVVFVGGNRDHGLIVAVDDRRSRIRGLQNGEVAVYTDEDQGADGCRIVLRRGNRIEIQARDIDIRAENRLHLSGRRVEVHADERRETDVNGYGEALNFADGLWTTDAYQREGVIASSMEHGLRVPEVNRFAETVTALEPQLTDMDRLLLCIPEIADAEATRASQPNDAQGWHYLASFLRQWFASPESTDKASGIPRMVDLNWLKSYSRFVTARSELLDSNYLFNAKARTELAKYLKKDLHFSRAGEFDYTKLPLESLHDRHFQFKPVDIPISTTVDGLTAALAKFTIYAVAAGSTEPVSGNRWRVTVTKVAVFVRDNFDFETDEDGFFGLGPWNCADKIFGDLISGTFVYNRNFRDFRHDTHTGGDFFVYAAPETIEVSVEPYKVYPSAIPI